MSMVSALICGRPGARRCPVNCRAVGCGRNIPAWPKVSGDAVNAMECALLKYVATVRPWKCRSRGRSDGEALLELRPVPRRPSQWTTTPQSVDLITSQDGFTQYDLVSYDRRHNEANGHGNADDTAGFSGNCGVEGDESIPPEVIRLRKQRIKNYYFCELMLSNGHADVSGGRRIPPNSGRKQQSVHIRTTNLLAQLARAGRAPRHLPGFQEDDRFSDKPSFHLAKSFLARRCSLVRSGRVCRPVSVITIACLPPERKSHSGRWLYVPINGSREPITLHVSCGSPGLRRKVIDTSGESPRDILGNDARGSPFRNRRRRPTVGYGLLGILNLIPTTIVLRLTYVLRDPIMSNPRRCPFSVPPEP